MLTRPTHRPVPTSPLSHSNLSLSLVSILAFASLFAIGCQTPSHHANDDIGIGFGFSKDNLNGTYVTQSKVTFSLDRNDDETREMTITSSDPSLLKPIEPTVHSVRTDSELCVGSACDPSNEALSEDLSHHQTFEVVAPGEVTVTFKDGDNIIVKRTVTLVEADELKAQIDVASSLADIDVSEMDAGRGEKVINGTSHRISLHVGLDMGGEFSPLGVSELVEKPTTDGVEVSSYRSVGGQLYLDVKPTREGRVSTQVKLGGKSIDLHFESVSRAEIDNLTVRHGVEGQFINEHDQEVPKGVAIAHVKDASGEIIFGTSVVWTRLDIDQPIEVEELYGDMLTFEYSETETVPFKVTTGNISQTVNLPMNPESTFIDASDTFRGCNATGSLVDHALMSILLLGLMALRARRRQRAA